MNYVWLVIDNENNEVRALYDTVAIAKTMKKTIEELFDTTVRIEKRTVNLDIKYIGVKP